MIESSQIEFKREYTNKINIVLLSFLNADGGTLYIGIDNAGKAVGVDDADSLLLKTINSFRDSVIPDPTGYITANPVKRGGKTVIEVIVERGEMIPYCLKSHGLVPKGVYVRVGNESVPASREHIRQMIRDNSDGKFIEELSPEQKLTFNYASKLFEEKDIVFGKTQKQTLGLIRADGRFSNLALILSDQCPYSIKAAIFQGTTKEQFKDRKEFSGSVFKQIDECLAYLNVYNKIASSFEGAYRVDHPDYPVIVLREALLNAVIHRDYYIDGSILVSMFENRLEIMSLGGIMPGVTKELMLAGVSVPRNEKLAAVFHRIKLIEAYGTGIPRIFDSYAEYDRTPEIPITNDGFLISLPNLNYAASIGTSSKLKSKNSSKSEQLITEKFNGQTFSKEQAAETLGMSVSGAYKLLARMSERELLSQTKSGKQIIYSVV
jgi:ATP-dependent DNA helicase RecG